MFEKLEYQLKDGNMIPALGLGTWQLVGDECCRAVHKALELGYRHIDTAEMYGNQTEIGKALKDFDRSKIFVTSKVWPNNLSYDEVLKACERTLNELDTDYLDLYLIHWPNSNIPVAETLRAFKGLVKDSKVRSVGVSNFTINDLKEAFEVTEVPIVVDQVEFHPYLYQKDLLSFCKENEIVITAYSPLGRGGMLNDNTIAEIARRYDRTPAQVCLRWSLQKGIVVIPKAKSEEHMRKNIDIFNWQLSPKDVEKIDSLNRNKSLLTP